MAQSAHFLNQSPYKNHLQNIATWAGLLSTSTIDQSVIEFFIQQQAFQRDTNTPISKFSELQTQFKNDHFLGNLQIIWWWKWLIFSRLDYLSWKDC